MSYSPTMAERIRETLLSVGKVHEKHMFGSLGFMVNGRLAVCVRNNDVMFKLGIERSQELIARGAAVASIVGGRTMSAWVDIPIERLSDPATFAELLAEATKVG